MRPGVSLPSGVAVGVDAALVERVAGVDVRVSAGSFFQSGPAAAELLIATVDATIERLARDAASPSGSLRVAVDLYAGVGLFAATSLRDVAAVTAVEVSAAACADARVNLADRTASTAAVNDSSSGAAASTTDLHGDARRFGDARLIDIVESEVGSWDGAPCGAGPVDLVIADPARSGLGRPGVAAVQRLAPAQLVLVSCDPASFARDTALLRECGYVPLTSTVLDLFPQTHHLEVVTGFISADQAAGHGES